MEYDRVKVRSTINGLGLKPGQEAEIDLTETVRDYIKHGLFLLLKPKVQ